MTRVRFIIKTLLLLFAAVNSTCTLYAQQSAQCGMLGNQIGADLMSSGGTALTSVKTGLEFNLSLTLPGQNGCNGTYSVNITTSNNITNGYTPQNYPYQFAATATNQYSNVTSLPSSGQGLGINIPFKFVPGTTCDGETGTFAISIDLTCADGSKHNCTLKLSLTAIAANYWTVEKHHVFGDLSGGALYWDVIIRNTNPTPGIGDLNIYSGSITDAVSSDAITSVTGNVNNLTGLNTATAKWSTGTIASTIPYVVYHVVTYSCKPAGTVVQNCVDYNFCLGKEVSLHAWNVDEGVAKANKPVDAKANKTPLVKTILPGGGTLQKPCCTGATGQACDTVTLTAKPNVSSNFAKTLTYGNNLNYSPGCEGEYQIVVTNNGNVPLNNIVVTDTFPSAQIDVTQITVTANSTSMNYNVGYNTTPYNTSGTPYPNFTQTWSGGYPTQFTLTTTSGTLLGGNIIIKVRFRIKATLTPGTVVNNCASLNYSGTYNGWANWCNVSLPPAGQSSSAQSCAPFTVQQPKAIPGIMKCIPNGQQTYSVGDIIHFRVVISNHGATNFNGNLADLLSLPQHLQYVPGSISYAQGEGAFSPYSTTPSCVSPSDLSNSTGWQTPTLSAAAQNISGAITNMPGECALDKAYYLIIDFDAKVLPQSFGQYVNTATLTTAGGTLHSDAYYNIMRVAKIITTKAASTGFVEAGQPFNYIINVCDAGSVGLTNIKVKDILPDCVTAGPGGATATVHTAAGTITTTAVTGAAPNYSFGSLTIQPGDTVQLVIPVTRKSTDNSKSCCNALAKGTASPADAVTETISDENGPACVVSSLCCNIEGVNVSTGISNINGGIVPAFLITTNSPIPIQEIEISLIDYHAVYNNASCRPANLGNLFGHIQPFVGYSGGTYYNFNTLPVGGPVSLQLQTAINPPNNSLTWSGTNPINLSGGWNFNGLIALNFVAPDIVNLDCCSGTVFFCFKVRIKDANCNICEKTVCFSATIPKKGADNHWTDEKAKDRATLQNLNSTQPGNKTNTQTFEELFKRNK